MCRDQPRVATSTRPVRSYTGAMESGCCLRGTATKPLPKASSSDCCRSGLLRRFQSLRSTQVASFCLRDCVPSWRRWQPGKVHYGSRSDCAMNSAVSYKTRSDRRPDRLTPSSRGTPSVLSYCPPFFAANRNVSLGDVGVGAQVTNHTLLINSLPILLHLLPGFRS